MKLSFAFFNVSLLSSVQLIICLCVCCVSPEHISIIVCFRDNELFKIPLDRVARQGLEKFS